ncbi:nervous system adducin [Elysia marginata]|uniref:Nervous system adducin n=1 Tax=Elysia marginata TaxID=1093978 RepID=A0AAV4JWS9_9GAST|nr:nervous system adducin [Elysia marginata]
MELFPWQSRGGLGNFVTASSVVPVNDLKGPKPSSYADGETQLRCKLAALYRVVELCGWSHGIYNHISARVDGKDEFFLLNPFGMMYSELTASALIKVDLDGKVIDKGSSPYSVNQAGWTLHSAIHGGRPDVKCIIHLHPPSAVAVMMLRNHGIVACGETIEEAFYYMFNALAACEQQVKAMQAGLDNLLIPKDGGPVTQNHLLAEQSVGGTDSQGTKWGRGELEFEALMRALENMGYRTGYEFRLLPVAKKNGTSSTV